MIKAADTQAKRRRADPDTRRAEILLAARNCFVRLGFDASSVDKIAAEAGVSVGLLYRFYPSKAAIIEAIVLQDSEAQFRALADAIDADALGAIDALVKAGFEQRSLDADHIVLMFEIAIAIHRNPDLRAFLNRRRAELKRSLTDRLVAKGMKLEAAARLLDRLDLASAIATGVAMHANLYAEETLDASLRAASELIAATLRDTPIR